jgi:Zn-dependent metalloprotease
MSVYAYYWNKLLLAAALTWGVPTINDALADSERLKPAKRAVARLQTESGGTLTIEWNKAAATPGLITGYLTKPSNHSPQWISIEFLKQIKALYGLKRVDEQMSVIRILHDRPDRTKVILQRQLYGEPVCGNELTVELDKSGVIVRVDGTIYAELEKKRLNRPMYPAITRDEAAAEASRYVDGRYPAEAARVQACYLPSREGVPLIYVISFDSERKDGTSIQIHSLTGRVIE